MPVDGSPEIENVEILELIGQGGMSRVYRARQTDLDRIVAVKVLTNIANTDAIQRFKNEAVSTSLLDHPNIVKTISFGVAKNQQPYLLLEYLEGKSLAQIIKQQGSLDYRRFRNIFLPVLSALQTASNLGSAYMAAGKKELAEKSYRRALELGGSDLSLKINAYAKLIIFLKSENREVDVDRLLQEFLKEISLLTEENAVRTGGTLIAITHSLARCNCSNEAIAVAKSFESVCSRYKLNEFNLRVRLRLRELESSNAAQ